MHIDTTGIQSLIDARNEVEQWANRPVEVHPVDPFDCLLNIYIFSIGQFHFATVLSPWIRHALIAGGFGIGTSTISIPTEIALVVPCRGGNRDTFTSNSDHQPDDAEAQGTKHGLSSRASSAINDSNPIANAPLYPADTPFIHFDLIAAVSAAESGLRGGQHLARILRLVGVGHCFAWQGYSSLLAMR